jgi:transcriptional regulator with XRE-family HTH domain
MNSKKSIILPKYQPIFDHLGQNLKLARKRRKLTSGQVAERAGINRTTLYKVEKGDPSVAIGTYFNVLKVLQMQNDLLKLASEDSLGRKLQDLELL